MKKLFTVFLNALLLVVFFSTTSFSSLKPIIPDKIAKMKVIESFGRLPLSFTENRGQLNSKVSYYLKGRKGTIYFTREGIVYDLITVGNPSKNKTKSTSLSHKKSRTFQRLSFTMKPIGANRDVRLTADNKLPGQVNYLIGNNPKKWHKEIPLYKEIVYKDLYKDIDLKIYGNNNRMEYDFIVSPGADPKVITIAFEGIEALMIDSKGDLLIKTPLGEITHLKPLIYQEIEGTRHLINGAFKVAENTFSFGIGDYDKEHALIIDPLTLSYSTYLGGNGLDAGSAIAVDSSGAAYVTGETGSTNFPTVNAYQGTYGGGEENDAFVTKLSPDGNTLSYSTYLGGSGWDYGSGIAVDSSGAAYVTGDTGSTNFPTVNAYQGTLGGGDYDRDAFVTKLSPAGNTLSYSTYLGGSGRDCGSGIAVDSSGAAYVTGDTGSTNFTTVNAYQGTLGGGDYDRDAFVTKLSPAGNTLSYSTYLGGSGGEWGFGIAVDSSGAAYVTGETGSTNFPTVNAYQGTYGGGEENDAFVTKLSPDGNTLSYSTYLGGSGRDGGSGIAVDSSGAAYVTGDTGSTNFPTVNAYQGTLGGNGDAFVTKLSPAGNTLSYSTYLGGNDYYDPYGNEYGSGIAVDSSGAAYVTGGTGSTDFPTNNAYQATFGGAGEADADAFVTKLSPAGNTLLYSTYLGGSDWDHGRGIAVDSSESAYITGTTTSTDFPTNNAYQGTHGGEADAFVTKFGTAQKRYWYVDGTVANPGDGTSPDKAFRAIQAAIDAAGKDDEIWLKKGTYELSSPVNVDKAVAIYGGFTGGETQRDQRDYSNNVTTIDGQGSVYHCFYITANATIDGLTITGGNANGSYPDSSGGGIFNDENSSSTITNCSFTGNSASLDGGGISNYNSSPTITNCSFSGNSADWSGGGIENSDRSSPTITNCSFSGNSASWGGGISNYNSSPAITNCSFSGNSAGADGGGIENFDNSSPTITNCSFKGNSADAYGGGIDNCDNSSPTITNCILWGNTATTDGPEIYNYDISSSPLVTYCDILGGYGGEGNINADPLFVDPSNDDFHLQATSPCIDKGNNSAPEIPNTDFEGDTRIVDGDNDGTATVDMGMDEYTFIDTDSDGLSDNWEMTYFGDLSQGPDGDYDGDGATNLEEYQAGTNPANTPPISDAGPDQTVIEGDTVTLDASSSTDSDDGIASYLWEQTDGPQVTLSSTTDLQPNFTAPSGIQNSVTITIQLTATDNGGLQDTDTVVITVNLSPVMPSAPDGDVAPLGNPDGTVNVGDALVCLRFALGLETPTQQDTAHGDVAPLDINGQPDPDGQITVGDALVILRKALGLVDWTLAPTSGELIKSQTIGAEGGTITLDNFSLTIPSGVFDSDVELKLYDLTGSLAFDEGVVTEAFRLEGLPDDYTQPLIPDIKYSGTLSDESFIVVGEEVFIPSLSTTDMAYHLFPAADSSNFLTYSPAGGSRSLKSSDYTSRSNSSRNFLDFFGITGWSTHRTDGGQGHFSIEYPKNSVNRSDIEALGQYLEKAYTIYENMGFSYANRTDWPVDVTVKKLGAQEYGFHCPSMLGHNSTTLQFNKDKLGEKTQLSTTAGHEFFHLAQYLYDPRNAISRAKFASTHHWLNEACAVWAEEKFTNTPNYVSSIRDGHEMAPFNGMHAGSVNGDAGHHGYGMSAFIKYLVSRYGESIIHDIYLKILDQKHPVQAINLSLSIDNNLFMIWESFLREYVTGNIYNVQKARFTAIKSGLFRIQSDTDRSKTFTENYSDLSAKLFMIRLDYPEIDKAASINLKIDQGVCDITAFKFKDNIQYLDHSSDKKLTIPDIRKLTDEGYNLLVMVTNSNYFSPYTNSKAIKLDITVSLPGTVTVSAASASDKIVADGTTSTLITAVVKDVDGNNIADGTKVEFTTTGGTLSGTSATTTNGEATVTLTSPTTIGSADITATVKEIDGTAVDKEISGSTKVDFIAGPIDTLILTSTPNTLPADGTSTSTVQATAKDINGNPVADESIGLTVSSGSLSAASAKTDSSGVVSVIYTTPGSAPPGGTTTITATTDNAVTATVVITINPSLSWPGWPDPQWCPRTGSNHVIDYPDGNPDFVTCWYHGNTDGPISEEMPYYKGSSEISDYRSRNGVEKQYYESGQLKIERPWQDNKLNGTEKRYYESGQLQFETPWQNDKKNGLEKEYHISASGYHLIHETPYIDGKKNGLEKLYVYSGQLQSETPWKDDKINGILKTYYYLSGQVKGETPYVDDEKNGTSKVYYESGQLWAETPYVDDKRNGLYKGYYENGQLWYQTPYVDDKKNGTEKEYRESGQLRYQTPYVDDKRNGIQKEYYESGELLNELSYVDDKKNGISKSYYKSGQVWTETSYVDDKINGQRKVYDKDGKLVDCKIYENDHCVGSCMP